MRKELGKITKSSFGKCYDRPFLVGLQLEFSFGGSCCGDGGRFLTNMSEITEHMSFTEQDRNDSIIRNMHMLNSILKDAKVDTVNQLIGKPVEITIENSCFKDFRILKEVL